jgi:hypothetical protein
MVLTQFTFKLLLVEVVVLQVELIMIRQEVNLQEREEVRELTYQIKYLQ